MASSNFQLELEDCSEISNGDSAASSEPSIVSISDGDGDDDDDSDCECLDPMKPPQAKRASTDMNSVKCLRQQSLTDFFRCGQQQRELQIAFRQPKREDSVPSTSQSDPAKVSKAKSPRRASTDSKRRRGDSAKSNNETKRKERKRKVEESSEKANDDPPTTSRPHKLTPFEDVPYCKRIPGTRFVVDAFSYGEVLGCNSYFLSHFHADHYGGLSSSFAYGTIYCSSVTAALLKLCLRVRECYIKTMAIGETYSVEGIQVTPVDANHCPGSFMFAFHDALHNRTHLHTGDFRACTTHDSLQQTGISILMNTHPCIDTLFLDTTYLDPDYAFPSQTSVINTAVRLANEALRNESRTLFVVGAYKIGKERVFAALARALSTRVYADATKLSLLRIVFQDPVVVADLNRNGTLDDGVLDLLTEQPHDAKVHVVSMMSLDYDSLRAYLHRWHGRFARICAFEPTGWSFTPRSNKTYRPLTHAEYSETIKKPDVLAYSLPYSEHSSYAELERFVKQLRPRQTIATVGSYTQRLAAQEAYLNPWTAASSTSASGDSNLR